MPARPEEDEEATDSEEELEAQALRANAGATVPRALTFLLGRRR